MWLLERGGRAALLAAAGALTLALGGCYVAPLYGHRTLGSGLASPAAAGGLAATLASVEVVPIKGRVGQEVRNDLIFRLTGGDSPAPARYRLAIVITGGPQYPVIDPFTQRPEVETLAIDAAFALLPLDGDKAVLRGNAFGRAGLNRNRQRFADLSAEHNAEDRAAQVVADQIFARLAAYFSDQCR
jgi:LPS-assembly lipoprotein